MMEYSTDIFLPEPPESCICAICHDVLKGASSFNCGHTFCSLCVDEVLRQSSPSCPNCRAVVATSNPNYVVKEIIDGLIVRCPYDGSNNDDEMGDCGWTGQVKDMESHGRLCDYKIIECNVKGCTHYCQRKDMHIHTDDMDVKLKHMELNFTNKLNAMEEKCENRIHEEVARERSSQEFNLRRMEDKYGKEIQTLQNTIQSNESKLHIYENRIHTLEQNNGHFTRRINTLENELNNVENELNQQKVEAAAAVVELQRFCTHNSTRGYGGGGSGYGGNGGRGDGYYGGRW